MLWVQALLPLLVAKVDFAGFYSRINLFIALEIWKFTVSINMYLYLFSIVCICYGGITPLEVVYTKPVAT